MGNICRKSCFRTYDISLPVMTDIERLPLPPIKYGNVYTSDASQERITYTFRRMEGNIIFSHSTYAEIEHIKSIVDNLQPRIIEVCKSHGIGSLYIDMILDVFEIACIDRNDVIINDIYRLILLLCIIRLACKKLNTNDNLTYILHTMKDNNLWSYDDTFYDRLIFKTCKFVAFETQRNIFNSCFVTSDD